MGSPFVRTSSLYVCAGRVALLGDAAHAMPPHLGAGAGQAIEDAFAMGWLLAHPNVTRDNVEVCITFQLILQHITETASCIDPLCIWIL